MHENNILDQDSFSIMGLPHYFDKEFLMYNSVCRVFIDNAYAQKKIFIKAYNERVHNFDDVYSIGLKLLYAGIIYSAEIAVHVIKQIRDVDISPDKFLEISRAEKNIDIEQYTEPLFIAKQSVDKIIAEVDEYRRKERNLQDLTKTKSNLGSGYGVAGWLFDGAINLAADAVRGVGHMYIDSKDRKKIDAYKKQLFEETAIGNYPNMSAYLKSIVEPMCLEIFSGVRPIIGLEPVLYPEDIQKSLDIIKKFKNYRPITTFEIIEGIFGQPYEFQLYCILLENEEKSYYDLLKLADFTGLKEKFNDYVASKINDWKIKGLKAGEAGNYVTAFKYHRLIAQTGDTAAMVFVASMYENGQGIKKNLDEAKKWYEKSANAGNQNAMYLLGMFLINHEQNYKESFEWFKKSADKGKAEAMYMIAEFYRYGLNIAVDSEQSLKWYEKAANAGDKEAAKELENYKDELLQIEEESLNADELFQRAEQALKSENNKVALRCYEKSSQLGNIQATVALAKIHEEGISKGILVPKDMERAFSLYLKAANADDKLAMLKIANYYDKGTGTRKNPDEASKWYQKLADLGNAEAIMWLAIKYDYGEGIAKDSSKAFDLYLKAANLGNINAMIIIAQKYESKTPNDLKDLKRALSWYEKAIEKYPESNSDLENKIYKLKQKIDVAIKKQADDKLKLLSEMKNGNSDAETNTNSVTNNDRKNLPVTPVTSHSKKNKKDKKNKKNTTNPDNESKNNENADELYRVGLQYYDSKELPSDFEKAFQYFEKAANAGNRDAMYYVGLMYLKGTGVKQNAKMAIEFLKKSAQEGNIEAINLIGDSYYSEEDFKKAFQFYLRAAETGHTGAMKCIGDMYYYGKGVGKDLNKSMAWYIRVAETGDTDAMIKIGNMYDCGEGVSKSQKKAAEWFTRAAELGSITAMLYIAEMYSEGEGVSKSQKKAAEWYTRAAELGNITAMRYIASRYVHGNGVPKDLNNALKWYLKILESGETTAAVDIGSMYEQNNEFELALQWYNKALKEYGIQSAQSWITNLEKKQKNANNTSQSDGCFITTAVCGSFNKPDDCYELTAFRNFRDNWLINQSDGKTLIKEYYQIAPSIVSKIDNLPSATQIYKKIWEKYLSPCLNLIENGDNQSCKRLYIEMVNSLKKKFL